MPKPFDLPHYGNKLPPGMVDKIPHDKASAIKIYGDPEKYLKRFADRPHERWEQDILKSFNLPEPLPYVIGGVTIKRIRLHEKIWRFAASAFQDVVEADLWDLMAPWAGSYNWRLRAGLANLSTHAWGIAFDINPAENPLGKRGDKATGILAETDRGKRLVKLLERWGWYWGGHWERPDAMHFQFGNW